MTSETSIFLNVAIRALTIYFGVFAGYLFMKSPLKKFRSQFVSITINFFTPILIFASLVNINSDTIWYFPVVAAILVTVVGIVVPNIISNSLGQDSPSPAELCTSTFSNALNFPFPIIFAFTQEEGLSAAGIFLALSILARNTVGFWISRSNLQKNYLKDLVLFPPIWAIIFGLSARIFVANRVQPIVALPLVEILFQIGIYATLMTVGFSIKKPELDDYDPIFRVGITRFVVSAFFAAGIVVLFNPPAIVGIPLIVQMVAPPAVYNGLYAEKLGLDTELTTQIILSLTIVALIVLPIELLVLQILYF